MARPLLMTFLSSWILLSFALLSACDKNNTSNNDRPGPHCALLFGAQFADHPECAHHVDADGNVCPPTADGEACNGNAQGLATKRIARITNTTTGKVVPARAYRCSNGILSITESHVPMSHQLSIDFYR